MNYLEFRSKERELKEELDNLYADYFKYINELYSDYKGKKVEIIDRWGDSVKGFWGGWNNPKYSSMDPIVYKIKKDGTQSSIRVYTSVRPDTIKIKLLEDD